MRSRTLLPLFAVTLAGAVFPATLPPASAATPISAKYEPPRNHTPLQSTFVDWDSLHFRKTAAGYSAPVFDQPTATLDKFEVHVTKLKPGASSHPPHHHPWEEMLVIKEGSLDVSINGKVHPARAGDLVFFASHDVHNATNHGDVPAVYYVINFVTDKVPNAVDRPAAEQAIPGKHGSDVIDVDHAPEARAANGSLRRNVIDAPTITFERLESHVSYLQPGMATSTHTRDAADEFFVVKSGTLEATVNSVSARLTPGSFYFVAANAERGMKNLGADVAAYQVIKVVSDKPPYLGR